MNHESGQLKVLWEIYFRDTLGRKNWQQAVERRMRDGLSWLVHRLEAFVTVEGLRILDVGCGAGDLLVALETEQSARFLAGIEPDTDWAQEAHRRVDRNSTAVYVAEGERLPFPDNTFDGVCSNQVIEHVRDPEAVLSEMLRVCVPGGWCYINGPNYLIPYETHYRVPLLPWLPRQLAEWWLARIGRDPTYFRCCIRFIHPVIVRRILRRLDVLSEVNVLQQSIAQPELLASEKARKVAAWVKWLPLPSWLVYLLLPTFSMIVWKPKYGDS